MIISHKFDLGSNNEVFEVLWVAFVFLPSDISFGSARAGTWKIYFLVLKICKIWYYNKDAVQLSPGDNGDLWG